MTTAAEVQSPKVQQQHPEGTKNCANCNPPPVIKPRGKGGRKPTRILNLDLQEEHIRLKILAQNQRINERKRLKRASLTEEEKQLANERRRLYRAQCRAELNEYRRMYPDNYKEMYEKRKQPKSLDQLREEINERRRLRRANFTEEQRREMSDRQRQYKAKHMQTHREIINQRRRVQHAKLSEEEREEINEKQRRNWAKRKEKVDGDDSHYRIVTVAVEFPRYTKVQSEDEDESNDKFEARKADVEIKKENTDSDIEE